jgi:hypothetical protein
MELDRLGKVQWVEAWDLAVKASSAGGADAEVKAAKVEGWDVAWAGGEAIEAEGGRRRERHHNGHRTKANPIERSG